MYTIIRTAYWLFLLHISFTVNYTLMKFQQFHMLQMITKSNGRLVPMCTDLCWTSEA